MPHSWPAMMEFLHTSGTQLPVLKGTPDENFDRWKESVDMIIDLQEFKNSAGMIAMAIGYCTDLAKAKAMHARKVQQVVEAVKKANNSKNAQDHQDAYALFLKTFRRMLAPSDLYLHWVAKLKGLELYSDEPADHFHQRLCELLDALIQDQKSYWESLSAEHQKVVWASLHAGQQTPAEANSLIDPDLDAAVAAAKAVSATDKDYLPYWHNEDAEFCQKPLVNFTDVNKDADLESPSVLALTVDESFAIKVAKEALWNFPELQKYVFFEKPKTLRSVIDLIERVRRYCVQATIDVEHP